MHSDMSYWIMYVEHVMCAVMQHVPSDTCMYSNRGLHSTPEPGTEVVAPVNILFKIIPQ